MTVLNPLYLGRFTGLFRQVLIVILINVPSVSFGLAFGWVSLVSGEGADGDESGEAVVAAVTTFVASLAGVPLSAWALSVGRKFAIISTSFSFVVCWSLKLSSSELGMWTVVCARVAAGLGGASAWALAPLLAREMCADQYRGAAVSALPLANNVGILLMYLAADAALPHSTILWTCLAISLLHCAVSLFMPESPSFLAAQGKPEEACRSLAWLRGVPPEEPSLKAELLTLPMPELHERSPFSLAKEMLRDKCRRRAFIIGAIAIVGQEMCGILSIMQYAERVFILTNGESEADGVISDVVSAGVTSTETELLGSPARHAVLLGAVQLVFSAIALYLVERVGRRPLLIWCSMLTGGALTASAVLVQHGSTLGASIALAVAVATDAAGLQPAPYSLFADMFHYEYRGCALMLVTAGASAGNAIESAVFPAAVAVGGLTAALALGASVTLIYAIFTVWMVPETKGRTPEQIYELLCPGDAKECENGTSNLKTSKHLQAITKNSENLQNEQRQNCSDIILLSKTELDKINKTNGFADFKENKDTYKYFLDNSIQYENIIESNNKINEDNLKKNPLHSDDVKKDKASMFETNNVQTSNQDPNIITTNKSVDMINTFHDNNVNISSNKENRNIKKIKKDIFLDSDVKATKSGDEKCSVLKCDNNTNNFNTINNSDRTLKDLRSDYNNINRFVKNNSNNSVVKESDNRTIMCGEETIRTHL